MKSRKNLVLGRKCSFASYPIFLIVIFNTLVFSQGKILNFVTFDELKADWEVDIIENTECKAKASDFDIFLLPLDVTTVPGCVWNEKNSGTSLLAKSYKYLGLKSKYCEVTWAKMTVKYYPENAVAYTYPCIHSSTGHGSFCYLKNLDFGETEPKWIIETFDIDLDSESFIEIKFALIPGGGRILYYQIIIEHDGKDPTDGSCTTTTTEASTTTEIQTTTILSTTTEGSTETADSEGTSGTTWFPRPSTTPSTTTTTQTTTTTTTLPPITDVTEEEEETTTDSPTSDYSDSTTSGSTPSDSTPPGSTTASGSSSTDSTPSDSTAVSGSTSTDYIPTGGSTGSDSSTGSSVTTSTRRPSSTTPSSDDDGFTLTQILLYFVLPASILIILLIGCICYYGLRSQKIRQGPRFKNLEDSHSYEGSNGNIPTIHVQESSGGGINAGFNPVNPGYHPSTIYVYNAPSPHLSGAVGPPGANGTSMASQYYPVQASTSSPMNQINVFNNPSSPNPHHHGVLLNIPDSTNPKSGPRSHTSSVSSSSRYPVMYTGEYASGNNLPRMRKKLD